MNTEKQKKILKVIDNIYLELDTIKKEIECEAYIPENIVRNKPVQNISENKSIEPQKQDVVTTATSSDPPEPITQNTNVRLPYKPVDSAVSRPMPKPNINHTSKIMSEVGFGKIAMGIGAVLLILIAISLFAIAVLPLLTDLIKSICLIAFSVSLIIFGNRLHKKMTWGMIPESIGLVGLFLSFVISHIVLKVFPTPVTYICVISWILLAGYYSMKREIIFAVIEQIGLFCSTILIFYNISSIEGDAGKIHIGTAVYMALFIFEAISLILSLRKKVFINNVIIYVGNFFIYLVSMSWICSWIDSQHYMTLMGYRAFFIIIFNLTAFFTRNIVKEKVKDKWNAYFMIFYRSLIFLVQSIIIYEHITVMPYNVTGYAAGYSTILITMFILSMYLIQMYREYVKDISIYHAIQGIMLLVVSVLIAVEMPVSVCQSIFMLIIFMILLFLSIKNMWDINEYYLLAVYIYTTLTTGEIVTVYTPITLLMTAVMLYILLRKYTSIPGIVCTKCDTMNDNTSMYCSNCGSKLNIDATVYRLMHIGIVGSLLIITLITCGYSTETIYRDIVMLIGCFCIMSVNMTEYKVGYLRNYTLRCIIDMLYVSLFLLIGIFMNGIIFWVFAGFVSLPQLILSAKMFIDRESNKGYLIAGIMSTVFVSYLLAHSSAAGILYSVVFLIISGICIIAGMLKKLKYLRIYGLVLSFVGIIKLLMIDISYSNLTLRAVSFLVAGLLCLGISFAYGKYEKIFNEKDEVDQTERI